MSATIVYLAQRGVWRPISGLNAPRRPEAYELTRDHFAELEAFNVVRVTQPRRYFLLVQSGDELLDWREKVAFYAGASLAHRQRWPGAFT